ncbi:hypothetical protein BDZ91DRAFT_762651 [Kalaharituber pfeilii]|nr:hypothetical protein BDZ91DRAFT_762651 [Kalaharituber pfeilii]
MTQIGNAYPFRPAFPKRQLPATKRCWLKCFLDILPSLSHLHSMASDASYFPFSEASCNTWQPEIDGSQTGQPMMMSTGRLAPMSPLASPSKRSKVSNNSSHTYDTPGKDNRRSTGTPTPCCTPANSPEKHRNSPRARSHRAKAYHRLRSPSSPPTPYISREKEDFRTGVSKLNLDLGLAERASLEMAAATLGSTTRHFASPGFFGSLEERQRRYREINQVRIRNWEIFYGDMDGQREGGGVRCMSATAVKSEVKVEHTENQDLKSFCEEGDESAARWVPVKL